MSHLKHHDIMQEQRHTSTISMFYINNGFIRKSLQKCVVQAKLQPFSIDSAPVSYSVQRFLVKTSLYYHIPNTWLDVLILDQLCASFVQCAEILC